MATKYLDLAGLSYFIEKLKNRQVAGLGLSAEDFSAEFKSQLSALHSRLASFDPASVASASSFNSLKQSVDGLAAIINSDDRTDGDKIINKLNEVFTFLSTISSDQKLSSILAGKADKATTIAGYGITDAAIVDGTITLGTASIRPLTQHQSLDAYATKSYTNSELAKKANSADIVALTNAEIDSAIVGTTVKP